LNAIGMFIALLAYAIGVRKKITLENLTFAYPEMTDVERKRIAQKSYKNLGVVFAEMLYLRFAAKEKIARHITISNPGIFHASLAQGKGLIVVAGHCANWEWLALGGALVLSKNFAVIRKNIQTSFTERFLEKMRVRTGNSLIN